MYRKSSLSGDSNCVEVDTDNPAVVMVRDSRRPERPPLIFTREEWRAFLGGIRLGEFEV
jgi:hypothetical protein